MTDEDVTGERESTGEMEPPARPAAAGAMRKRRTTLEDGRYLIYYTFGDEEAPRVEGADEKDEPEAGPVAGEEESV